MNKNSNLARDKEKKVELTSILLPEFYKILIASSIIYSRYYTEHNKSVQSILLYTTNHRRSKSFILF